MKTDLYKIKILIDEQLKDFSDRIKAVADMGDVIQIKSIAEELKSEFDVALV